MTKKISVFRSPEIEAEYNVAYEAALQLWPVPYDEFYISTRFGDTHVIASGSKDAPPLVLLQPTGAGAAIWYRNAGPLSQQHRIYAIDTISEANKSILTLPIKSPQDFISWIIDLFRGLQIERVDIVGNSFGGFLTLSIALHLPERVKKAVLISPAATFMVMWPSFWHLFIPAHVIAPRIGSKSMILRSYAWIWQGFPIDDCIMRLRNITAINGLPRHGPPTVFADEELQKIQTPILLLIGDHEMVYKPDQVIRRATRLVPNLKAEIIPGANHNAQYTAADVVNKKVLDFLLAV
ncbi:MAG TPA: alpha/beta hydrolase [Anaerolineales bacterium]|nr:alpha/beta hydrolase [Anaerolineales bacterium]HLO29783.1 alpha/beta hydrolase [Anaerolineales bacterium]